MSPPGLSDIETVYGYSGPVATTTLPDFLAEAWRGFEGWCREQNVVCEFIRFSPILRSERFAAPQTEVKLDRETVEIRLEGGEEALWQGYKSAQRNRVRKAIRRGLTCHETSLDEASPPSAISTKARCGAQVPPTFISFPTATTAICGAPCPMTRSCSW